MKAPPEVELVFGIGLSVYSLVMLWSASYRPKLLDRWWLRPRWEGTGPRAGRVGAAFGAAVWLCVGVFVIHHAVGQLV